MIEIIDYLDKLFPNPKCELNYKKDYELLIAVMLSAQTTDKRVNIVTDILFKKYDNLEKLASADINDIIDIIKPIGTYKKKSIFLHEIVTKLVENESIVPNDRKFLESLPGVGRKTVNVFLSNIYNEPYIAVDTHVERVSKRLGLAKQNDNVYRVEKKLERKIPKEKRAKAHHQLVLFGRYHCKAIKPNCHECEFKEICKYYENRRK